jgi:hypothetical protein
MLVHEIGVLWAPTLGRLQKRKQHMTGYKYRNTFPISNLFIKIKPLWIWMSFKLQTIPTHKIKYKSTYQSRLKYAAAWMKQTYLLNKIIIFEVFILSENRVLQ